MMSAGFEEGSAAALSTAARFEREVLPFRGGLERAARRYTSNRYAEDLVQETLVKAWAGAGSFDPGTNLRAWMHRTLVSTWISAYRRAERRPHEWLTDSFTKAQPTPWCPTCPPPRRGHCSGGLAPRSDKPSRPCPRTCRPWFITPASAGTRTRRSLR
jgi:DNA-directed RNA polymerase specialized sigma24 family protein